MASIDIFWPISVGFLRATFLTTSRRQLVEVALISFQIRAHPRARLDREDKLQLLLLLLSASLHTTPVKKAHQNGPLGLQLGSDATPEPPET